LVLGTAGGGALFSQGQIAIDAYPVEGIEYKPLPAIFVVAARGAVREASLELTNTRSEALEIVGISNTSERFKARVDILEEGRRFRIVVTLKGEGPAGRKQEILQLKTNLADAPVLRIPVNYRVRETVYSFPQSVFMGRYPLSEVAGNQELSRSRAQTLMVYRKETTGFEIKASSDIPFLRIESEQGPDGDRWENTIYYDVEKASAGEVRGTIFIETNDPDVPRLEVPVWGDLQPR
jgi:hypothetical protein